MSLQGSTIVPKLGRLRRGWTSAGPVAGGGTAISLSCQRSMTYAKRMDKLHTKTATSEGKAPQPTRNSCVKDQLWHQPSIVVYHHRQSGSSETSLAGRLCHVKQLHNAVFPLRLSPCARLIRRRDNIVSHTMDSNRMMLEIGYCQFWYYRLNCH